ncbi:MAG: glycosyltransferase family 4 protein [Candidatus Rifleibacteriota bacterium]
MSKGRLLFVVTEDWYLSMHFLHIAMYARKEGWDVTLICNTGQKGTHAIDQILDSGLRFVPVRLSRSAISPLNDLKTFRKIFNFVKEWRPDIIFSVAIKPIMISGLISRWFGIPLLSMMTGLGYVFTSDSLKAALVKPFIRGMLEFTFASPLSRLLVLNSEDVIWAEENLHVRKGEIRTLPGIGVDLDRFKVVPEPEGIFTLAYVGRMLKDKGIYELIDAVKILQQRKITLKLMLAGEPDPSNPASVKEEVILEWQRQGLCEYHGHIMDVPGFLNRSHALVLPSYREGMPTCIIEASASGLPCVTTDVAGCREAVIHGKTGLIVPVRNSEKLAEAIAELYHNPDLRRQMGENARRMAIDLYSQEIVQKQMVELFSEWAGQWGGKK